MKNNVIGIIGILLTVIVYGAKNYFWGSMTTLDFWIGAGFLALFFCWGIMPDKKKEEE